MVYARIANNELFEKTCVPKDTQVFLELDPDAHGDKEYINEGDRCQAHQPSCNRLFANDGHDAESGEDDDGDERDQIKQTENQGAVPPI
jgi:hypothetical protein